MLITVIVILRVAAFKIVLRPIAHRRVLHSSAMVLKGRVRIVHDRSLPR